MYSEYPQAATAADYKTYGVASPTSRKPGAGLWEGMLLPGLCRLLLSHIKGLSVVLGLIVISDMVKLLLGPF